MIVDIKFKVILKMFFLKISNINISFNKKTLISKFYIINKALLTIRQVQIIYLKEFIIVVLEINNKMFIVYMAIQK